MVDLMDIKGEDMTDAQIAEAWRNIAAQLAAALRMARRHMDSSAMSILILPDIDEDFVTGHVIDGALASHDYAMRNFPQPF